jgi:hypothetical protein
VCPYLRSQFLGFTAGTKSSLRVCSLWYAINAINAVITARWRQTVRRFLARATKRGQRRESRRQPSLRPDRARAHSGVSSSRRRDPPATSLRPPGYRSLRHLDEALVPEIVDAEALQSGLRGQHAPSGAHRLVRPTEVKILALACQEKVMVRFASPNCSTMRSVRRRRAGLPR